MSASEKQVGGNHYKTKKGGVQHWDYCSAANVPYLESAATKYLTRWRDKGGVQDIEKAVHYIEKRLEDYHNHVGVLKGANKQQALFNRFMADNEIASSTERDIINIIMHWRKPEQLVDVIGILNDVITDKRLSEGEATSAYVNQDK